MKPLSAQRVIDVTQNVAGPFERPGAGDDTRHWTPQIGDGMSATYATFNRGKPSVALDLDHPEGQKLLRRLLKPDDILMHSLKPGSAEQRGRGTPS